jgi:hypothetical protein
MTKNIAVHAAVAFICVSLLGGCANLFLSSEQLRAGTHQKGSINFADPYAVVLASIIAGANKCFPDRPLSYSPYTSAATSPHMAVRSVELESGKLAKVEGLIANLAGGGAEDVFMSLDIRAIPSGTEVDYYIGRRFFGSDEDSSKFIPIANAWVRGDGTKCD